MGFGRSIVFNSMNKSSAGISVASVTSVYSSGGSITVPSTASSGDVIVLFQWSRGTNNGLAPTAVNPTGMTLIGQSQYNVFVSPNSLPIREMTSYAIIGSSGINANTSLTGMSGTVNNNKYLLLMKMSKPATTLSNVFAPTGNLNLAGAYSYGVDLSSLSGPGALMGFTYFTTTTATNYGNSSYISMTPTPNVIVNPGIASTYAIYSIQDALRPSQFTGYWSSLATGWNVSLQALGVLIN